MNNTKFSWKGYWEPTPKGIRKIADSLLAGGMLIATFSVFADRPKFAFAVMLVCGIAKIFSNFFTDVRKSKKNQSI